VVPGFYDAPSFAKRERWPIVSSELQRASSECGMAIAGAVPTWSLELTSLNAAETRVQCNFIQEISKRVQIAASIRLVRTLEGRHKGSQPPSEVAAPLFRENQTNNRIGTRALGCRLVIDQTTCFVKACP
jgi:hypothetical protein